VFAPERRALVYVVLLVLVLAAFAALALWGPGQAPCEEPGPYDLICST
jgi:hypothetical protein